MKTTSKSIAKCKAAALAPNTATKHKRKVVTVNDDIIQEPATVNEDLNSDVNTQEQAAAANASINELLELSDDDNDLSEGNFSL